MAEGESQITVAYTPAGLAGSLEAGKELHRISKDRADGGGLSKEMLDDLRASGWFRQVRRRRGGYFTTRGLRDATGNPDLVLLNVPGVFAPSALQLLNHIADHFVETGEELLPGDIFALTDPTFPEMAVTFDLAEPGDLMLQELQHPMLVVIPLP